MPVPADVSEAFDQAVTELMAWDGSGNEPSVDVGGRPTLISAIARLAETHHDTMPASLFWRMVGYANRPEHILGGRELSNDSSYPTGAWCLLQWVENIKEQTEKLHADLSGRAEGRHDSPYGASDTSTSALKAEEHHSSVHDGSSAAGQSNRMENTRAHMGARVRPPGNFGNRAPRRPVRLTTP
jgi:hypothetical protein